MNKVSILSGIIVAVISGVISGCASVTPSQPGSEKVTITREPIAQNCKFKGHVSATNGVGNMSPSRHSELIADEYGRLRNQAMKLGANTVLLSPSSGMTDKKHWMTKTQHSDQAAHVYDGAAYWCPVR